MYREEAISYSIERVAIPTSLPCDMFDLRYHFISLS